MPTEDATPLEDAPDLRAPQRRSGRRPRFRVPSLLLATFGWIVQASAAFLLAEGAEVTPLVLLGTGSALLVLALRGDGDLPYAAVGIAGVGAGGGAIGGVAMAGVFEAADGALGLLVGLAGVSVVSLLFVIMPWLAARSSQLTARAIQTVFLCEAIAVAIVGFATFPAAGSGHEQRVETAARPAPRAHRAEIPRGAMSAVHRVGDVDRHPSTSAPENDAAVSSNEPDTADAPAATGRAAHASLPTPARSRGRSMPAGFAFVWLVGLLLAGAGTLAVERGLTELRRLEGAVAARRTARGFLLSDGERVWLDREPPEDVALVALVSAARSYRADARIRGSLVGTGTLVERRDALQRRIATVALATVLTTAAAWLPLIVLRIEGFGVPMF